MMLRWLAFCLHNASEAHSHHDSNQIVWQHSWQANLSASSLLKTCKERQIQLQNWEICLLITSAAGAGLTAACRGHQWVVKTHRFCCNDTTEGKSDTHLMSCMLLYESLVVWVPEANTPIIGGADTDVTLACVLTEWKARHEVFMADELTWKTQCWMSASYHKAQLWKGKQITKLSNKTLTSLLDWITRNLGWLFMIWIFTQPN